MRNLEEKTIASETIFEGRVVRLQIDRVELPDGGTSTREIVKHPGAVSVLAVTEENKLVMVRQFRKPLEKTILEIPAGKLEAGENPADCAMRELEEETGYRAEKIEHVVSFYTSPGFADEYLHIYRANGLSKGEARLDQDEFVELVELTLDECLERIAAGEICDAKTVAAVYLWQNQVLRGRSV
ncbi:NUDIX hydrolase [Paenactinomyces guangxiensis]|nr:NUDIX hydrolase [Paenactinomyces guangxiensis]